MEPGHDSHVQRCEDAAYAYCGGEFEVAAAIYSELLRDGCIKAAIGMAEMYLRGEGVEADVTKGLDLLRQAAAAGDHTAAFNLGALHRSGDCHVPRDAAESRRFFLLARELVCPLPIDDFLG
jgi:TPR repeat protein